MFTHSRKPFCQWFSRMSIELLDGSSGPFLRCQPVTGRAAGPDACCSQIKRAETFWSWYLSLNPAAAASGQPSARLVSRFSAGFYSGRSAAVEGSVGGRREILLPVWQGRGSLLPGKVELRRREQPSGRRGS